MMKKLLILILLFTLTGCIPQGTIREVEVEVIKEVIVEVQVEVIKEVIIYEDRIIYNEVINIDTITAYEQASCSYYEHTYTFNKFIHYTCILPGRLIEDSNGDKYLETYHVLYEEYNKNLQFMGVQAFYKGLPTRYLNYNDCDMEYGITEVIATYAELMSLIDLTEVSDTLNNTGLLPSCINEESKWE